MDGALTDEKSPMGIYSVGTTASATTAPAPAPAPSTPSLTTATPTMVPDQNQVGIQNPTPPSGPSLPNPMPEFDLAHALLHPFRTLGGLFQFAKGIFTFDRYTPVVAANSPAALSDLQAAEQGLSESGLDHLLPFMNAMIQSRAAKALTTLRPDIEQSLGTRVGHPVTLVWPSSGSWSDDLNELAAIARDFAAQPDAVVQKALSGISEIDVTPTQILDTNPVKVDAATLMVERPISWLPGQTPVASALNTYMTQLATVQSQV